MLRFWIIQAFVFKNYRQKWINMTVKLKLYHVSSSGTSSQTFICSLTRLSLNWTDDFFPVCFWVQRKKIQNRTVHVSMKRQLEIFIKTKNFALIKYNIHLKTEKHYRCFNHLSTVFFSWDLKKKFTLSPDRDTAERRTRDLYENPKAEIYTLRVTVCFCDTFSKPQHRRDHRKRFIVKELKTAFKSRDFTVSGHFQHRKLHKGKIRQHFLRERHEIS